MCALPLTLCFLVRNVIEAIWSVGGHGQLARFCASMLLIARQVTDVRFGHVKAHEGNPFNELADCLAKRAAGDVVAPLPDDVSSLLACRGSVTWEWLHGLPPAARVAYPPLCDGCFAAFDEARSSVEPCNLIKGDALDVDESACRTDVTACVSFGSFNVCTLGDSGSRSKFAAGRPALIRRQVRELGVNLLGVQEARSAAGARVVDGYVVLASVADRGTLGCELWADTGSPYASFDGKDYCFRQSDYCFRHNYIAELQGQRDEDHDKIEDLVYGLSRHDAINKVQLSGARRAQEELANKTYEIIGFPSTEGSRTST